MNHASDSPPHVLGHPATKEWCEAVDAHHASTERIVAELRADLTAAREKAESLEKDKARLDRLAELIVTQYAVTFHADPKAGTIQLFAGGPQIAVENNLRQVLDAAQQPGATGKGMADDIAERPDNDEKFEP